jgi:toxic protein SymE
MTSTEKKQTQEPEPVPTFKRVIHKQIEEESVILRAEVPKVRYLKLQPFYRESSTFCSPAKIVPELRLCGKWLEAAGFLPKEYVSVTVMDGLLVIRSTGQVETNK